MANFSEILTNLNEIKEKVSKQNEYDTKAAELVTSINNSMKGITDAIAELREKIRAVQQEDTTTVKILNKDIELAEQKLKEAIQEKDNTVHDRETEKAALTKQISVMKAKNIDLEGKAADLIKKELLLRQIEIKVDEIMTLPPTSPNIEELQTAQEVFNKLKENLIIADGKLKSVEEDALALGADKGSQEQGGGWRIKSKKSKTRSKKSKSSLRSRSRTRSRTRSRR